MGAVPSNSMCVKEEKQPSHANSTVLQRAHPHAAVALGCHLILQSLSTALQQQLSEASNLHLQGGTASLIVSKAEQLLDSLAFQPDRQPGDCKASRACACYSNKSPFVT